MARQVNLNNFFKDTKRLKAFYLIPEKEFLQYLGDKEGVFLGLWGNIEGRLSPYIKKYEGLVIKSFKRETQGKLQREANELIEKKGMNLLNKIKKEGANNVIKKLSPSKNFIEYYITESILSFFIYLQMMDKVKLSDGFNKLLWDFPLPIFNLDIIGGKGLALVYISDKDLIKKIKTKKQEKVFDFTSSLKKTLKKKSLLSLLEGQNVYSLLDKLFPFHERKGEIPEEELKELGNSITKQNSLSIIFETLRAYIEELFSKKTKMSLDMINTLQPGKDQQKQAVKSISSNLLDKPLEKIVEFLTPLEKIDEVILIALLSEIAFIFSRKYKIIVREISLEFSLKEKEEVINKNKGTISISIGKIKSIFNLTNQQLTLLFGGLIEWGKNYKDNIKLIKSYSLKEREEREKILTQILSREEELKQIFTKGERLLLFTKKPGILFNLIEKDFIIRKRTQDGKEILDWGEKLISLEKVRFEEKEKDKIKISIVLRINEIFLINKSGYITDDLKRLFSLKRLVHPQQETYVIRLREKVIRYNQFYPYNVDTLYKTLGEEIGMKTTKGHTKGDINNKILEYLEILQKNGDIELKYPEVNKIKIKSGFAYNKNDKKALPQGEEFLKE